MAEPYEAEIADLSGVDQYGRVADVSYAVWRNSMPAGSIPPVYNASTAETFKWADGTPGVGATITYWLDRNLWTSDQQAAFTGALALWMAVAKVEINLVNDPAQADFRMLLVPNAGDWNNGPFVNPEIGSTTVGVLPRSPDNRVAIDPAVTDYGTDLSAGQGYGTSTLVHEFGHMLGLGHGGPYDGNVNPMVQQFGPYDMRLWTIMSYIAPSDPALYGDEYPVTGTQWNGYWPLTPMILDILAVQRLYGVATEGPLTGGNHTFGFNTNIQGPIRNYYDFGFNKHPIVTIWENGTHNTLDLSGYDTGSVIDLHAGSFSSAAGMTNNIAIAFGTIIDKGIGGHGNDIITASDVASTLEGGDGSDVLRGGAGDDLLVGGEDPDTINPGGGRNVLRDTLEHMDGDTVFDFGQSTTIDVTAALVGRDHVIVTHFAGTTSLVMGDTEILIEGAYGNGDFMAVARGSGVDAHTQVTFEPYLPALAEGVRVAADAINGIVNQPFLTGDGAVRFTASLEEAVSTFDNSLGYYTVAADGTIGTVRMLFADTHDPASATVDLGALAAGMRIGFFLVQDGFDRFGTLSGTLAFTGPGGSVASIDGGPSLVLTSTGQGALAGATIFHSFQSLNPGNAIQVLSGVAPGGEDLWVGFEDTANGDADYQDVVIAIHTNADHIFIL